MATERNGFALRAWCHPLSPKRDHGDPQSFRLRSEGKGIWCGRRDLNPRGPCGPTDFRTRLRLSPPWLSCQGLGSGLSLHRAQVWLRVSGAARLVSTPSQPEHDRSGKAYLGIAMLQGFPEFEQFCIAGFPASTQV